MKYAIIMIGLLSAYILGAVTSCAIGRAVMRVQAVNHGAAYWLVKEDGSTEFRWKDAKEDKP